MADRRQGDEPEFKLSTDEAENPLVPASGLTPYGVRQGPTFNGDGSIEGEFTAGDSNEDWKGKFSGFYCKKCETATTTGDKYCPGCGIAFQIPTVSLRAIERMPRTYASWMSSMNRERWSQDQLDWLRQQRRKRR